MQDGVSFTCRACNWDGSGDRPELHQPAWAQVSGYDGCVRWLAREPAHPSQHPLLAQTPACGDEHWLAVRLPFAAEVGEPFRCLYRPPLSDSNGWSEHPEELGRSAIVCCTLTGIRSIRSEGAEVRAKITDVWALDEIGSLFPQEGRIGANFWEGFAIQSVSAAQWRELSWVSGSFEGDVATSALFETRAGRRYLILAAFSSHHADFVFVGNSPVEADAEPALQDLLARGRRAG